MNEEFKTRIKEAIRKYLHRLLVSEEEKKIFYIPAETPGRQIGVLLARGYSMSIVE